MRERVAWLRAPLALADEGLRLEVRERSLGYPLGSDQAEEVALLARLRPMIRRTLPAEQADERARFFEARGLLVERLPRAGDAGGEVLLVSWQPARLDEAAACEAALQAEPGHAPTVRKLAGLLGHPPCCAEASAQGAGPASGGGLLEAAVRRTQGPGEAWLNVLDREVFHLLPWVPCSFRCPASRAHVERVEALLRPHFSPFLRAVRGALACARLFLRDDVQLCLEGEESGEDFRVRFASPTARYRHPSSVLAPEAEEEVVRALAEVRGAQGVREHAGELWLDGVPWARGELARFGG